MIPHDFLKSITKGIGVSTTELEALEKALQGNNIETIAQHLNVTKEAIQKRLGEIYKKFHIEGRGPGKLTRLQQKLMEEYQKHLEQFGTLSNNSTSNETKHLLLLEIDKLSPVATQILYALAITEIPLGLAQLQKAFTGDNLSDLLIALASLLKDSLVEQISKGETNQFIVDFSFKQWVLHQCQQFNIEIENKSLDEYPKIYKELAKNLNDQGYDYYHDKGELNTAKFNLKLATNLHENYAAAHYNLGTTYEQLHQHSLAVEHYEKSFSLNKKASYASLCNLSRLDILAGNNDKAIERITSILNKVKDIKIKAGLLKNLSWAYLLNKNISEAEKYAKKSLEMNQEKPIIHCLMAQILEAKNKDKEAVKYWKNVLEYSQNHKYGQQGVYWQPPELVMWRLQAYQKVKSNADII